MVVRWMAVAGAVVFLGVAGPVAAQSKPSLKTDQEKISYSLGFDTGSRFPKESVDIDPAAFGAGFADGVAGKAPAMGEDEFRKVLTDFQQQMRVKLAAAAEKAAADNRKQGEEFLAKNKKKKDVVTLPSGLQYKIVKKGTGPKPKKTDTVTVHYVGTLIDGTEFDSSIRRGEPASFPVDRVIKGWTEALQLMPTGSKWQLFIPSDLAYGAQGAGQSIGPNSTLLFDVELLDIKK